MSEQGSLSSPEFSVVDYEMMARAVQLARHGLYTTMPNPRVGCILHDGKAIISEGWHRKAGEPHAEVNALNAAGEKSRGATAYVTLEPCNHTGRTGPCSQALIDAGVRRVVYGMKDPNPLVSGGGLQRMIDAGIIVEGPLLEVECRALNPGFIKRMSEKRPFVRCKVAISLDGRTAMASGESQWITGPAARSEVQKLRARSCAIVTGIGSILHDDSALTVRPDELTIENSESAAEKQPLRVVLDTNLRLPNSAKVVQCAANSLVVTAGATSREDLKQLGVEQVDLQCSESKRIDLDALMALLAQRECNEVLVETGATLAGAFMQAGLIDELVVFMAPVLLGSSARPMLEMPLAEMAEKRPLQLVDQRQVGNDLMMVYRPQ